ncbi:MAG: ATP-grasp domain-containing protein [Nitrospira sp.]|nr:ATP-grasp domain-containing protein [Nitrospira sp.]
MNYRGGRFAISTANGIASELQNSNYKGRAVGPPRVLLTNTNRWHNAARLSINLSEAGCIVAAVCPTHHPVSRTGVAQRIFPYSGVRPLNSLRTAIDAIAPSIIIPCDDLAVEHLHELYAYEYKGESPGSEIDDLIVRSLGSPESYPIVSARYDLTQTAAQEGIRVPDTALLNTVNDLESWRARQAFPWVLKADGTSGGRSVKIVYTLTEAEQRFSELSKQPNFGQVLKWLLVDRESFWLRHWLNRWSPRITIQSYINGHPANCAVVCSDGRVLAGISVEVLCAKEQTGPAIVVRVIDNTEMMGAAERIARRLRLSGLFGLDFIIEEGSGMPYLIEMNPRCTPLSHLRLGKGKDLIAAIIAQISGQPAQETRSVTSKDIIAYFPQALKSKSPILESAFHDIPEEAPELVQEILHPWPARCLLFRAYKHISRSRDRQI